MIYEIRVYQAAEGRAAAMRERFKREVAPRMPSHGIELLGVFTAPIEDGTLTYLTRFSDEATRSRAWTSFQSDPDWLKAKALSEVDGPLLASQTISVLAPLVAGLLLG